MDVTFALVVVNATAVALSPDKPLGDVLIETIGVPVNPEPSLFKNISRIYPVATTGDAVLFYQYQLIEDQQYNLHLQLEYQSQQ